MSMLSKYEADYIRKKKWYDQVDLYLCPSEFYRNKLTEGKFTSSPIVTLRNPLPLGTVYEASEQDEGYVLYYGRLSSEKGVKTLIEAAKKCGCRLVILGTGPQEEELKSCAQGCVNIAFEGFQTGEALKHFIQNSHCVVMPSECYENGPYSAMEAMAMGKPLIVSSNGGLPELVDDGVNGYIYEKDADALAMCIEKMLRLPDDEYKKMACSSLGKAKAMFNAGHYVEEIEQWHQKIKEKMHG